MSWWPWKKRPPEGRAGILALAMVQAGSAFGSITGGACLTPVKAVTVPPHEQVVV